MKAYLEGGPRHGEEVYPPYPHASVITIKNPGVPWPPVVRFVGGKREPEQGPLLHYERTGRSRGGLDVYVHIPSRRGNP